MIGFYFRKEIRIIRIISSEIICFCFFMSHGKNGKNGNFYSHHAEHFRYFRHFCGTINIIVLFSYVPRKEQKERKFFDLRHAKHFRYFRHFRGTINIITWLIIFVPQKERKEQKFLICAMRSISVISVISVGQYSRFKKINMTFP